MKVSTALSMSPKNVMDTMTTPQIGLICKYANKDDLRFAETQAGIIWSMAAGKYKPMTDTRSATGKKAIDQTEKLFGIEDKV